MQTLFAIYQGRARLSLARSARSLRRGAPDEMARPYRRSRRRLIVFSTETLSGLIDTPPATMGLPARRGVPHFLKPFPTVSLIGRGQTVARRIEGTDGERGGGPVVNTDPPAAVDRGAGTISRG